jgi:hypothetical protein
MPPAHVSKKILVTTETFNFDVTEWTFDYGFHLDPTGRAAVKGFLGPCWETNAINVRGPLQSKTKRRIERIQLRISPGAPEAESWDMARTRFGGVSPPRQGTLAGVVQLPTPSFLSLMMALGAGKVGSICITVDRVAAKDAITSFSTRDPAADSEDE